MQVFNVICQQTGCDAICVCDGKTGGDLQTDNYQQLLQPLMPTEAPGLLDLPSIVTPGPSASAQLTSELHKDINALHASVKHRLVERPRIFANDVYYQGQWLDNMRHGKGRLERPGWGWYVGQFVYDRATGEGQFEKNTGDKYEGQWRDDRAHGEGCYTHSSGSRYQGQWQADLKCGEGKEDWPDGSNYHGHFFNGTKHGHGRYDAGDGSSYYGQFVEDVMEGRGSYTFQDGRIYDGQWKSCRMQGHGTMTWHDGKMIVKVYEGHFESDQRSGRGRLRFKNGCVYEGEFKNGKQHGNGEFTNTQGRTVRGKCKDGKKITIDQSKITDDKSVEPTTAEILNDKFNQIINVQKKHLKASTKSTREDSFQVGDEFEARTSDGCLSRIADIDGNGEDERVCDIDTGAPDLAAGLTPEMKERV